MKNIYVLLLAVLVTSAANAQQFFTAVSYKGAFGIAGSADWTSGWANWDPENTVYPAINQTVSSDITSNTTWTTGSVISLKNKVYVTNNATLTIQPGVIIRGDKATEGTLIISRGSKIMAQGTQVNPIVFTSGFDVADGRSPGDWGGVIILGSAITNITGGTAVVEGGLDANKANYGGTNSADNSGVFQYVRIEFAGFPFQPDKEINGLTFGAVGSGTTVDHIQVSFCNDDAFEWFGGSVNAKHLISYRNIDDDFDTDNGFNGNVQFGLIIRDALLADQCTCSTSEGFESDNDASGTGASPKTSAVFSNITVVGPYRGSTSNSIDTKFKRALRIRRNSSISVFNSIFTDFPTGLHVDGTASESNAISDNLEFRSNVLAGMGANLQVNSGSTFDINSYFVNGANTSFPSTSSVMFVNPYPVDFLNADYRLQSGSTLLSGADFSNPKLGNQFVNVRDINTSSVANVYPNPVKDQLTIEFVSEDAKTIDAVIYDITGKAVHQFLISAIPGSNRIMIEAGELSNGMYLLNMNNESLSGNTRFIVARD